MSERGGGTAATFLAEGVAFGRATLAVFRDQQVSLLAAAVAYYAFVSVIPLLVLVVVIASLVGGEALADRVATGTRSVLTPTGRELLADAIAGGRGRGGATVLGLGILAWSGLRLFRGLDRAFSTVYGVGGEESFLEQLRDGAAVFGGIAVGVAGVTGGVALLARLNGGLVVAFAPVVLIATLSVAFLPIYYVFPDVPLSVRDVLPGTAVAAVGWAVLGGLFQLYAAASGGGSLYGALGGVLLLITWFYFGAMLVLGGAVVNAVASGHASPDRQVQTDGGRHSDR